MISKLFRIYIFILIIGGREWFYSIFRIIDIKCWCNLSYPLSISAYVHYYFDESGLIGFYIQWIFDPLFSSQIIYECDVDLDNSFSEEEVKQVGHYYFSHLVDYNYYIKLKIDDKKEPIAIPLNFNAEIDKDDDNVVIGCNKSSWNYFIYVSIKTMTKWF